MPIERRAWIWVLRRLPLATLATLALFPFGWLGQRWPAFDRWLGAIFATPLAHIAGHAAIFLNLGLAVLLAAPALLRRPRLYASLVLAAALGQELFQLLYKGRGVAADDLIDLCVDALAATAAFALAHMLAGRARPEQRYDPPAGG